MTGTPIQESPEDLWAVLRLLDRRSRNGPPRYLLPAVDPRNGLAGNSRGRLNRMRHAIATEPQILAE